MGFEIVDGSPMTVWAPIVDGDTLYVGQIVECQSNEGCAPIGAAAGAADTTGKAVPFGVVVGTNLKTDVYSSTYNSNSVTEATPHDSTTEFVGQEGNIIKGGGEALVQVALITPHTLIKGQIFNSTFGTAISVGTETTGSTTGKTFTSDTAFNTGVANICTIYFRSGANRGAYRITDDTSTTTITFDKATYKDIAIGDTAVRVPLRYRGQSFAQFDSESMFIDGGATPATDYYVINVVEMNLSEAGKEYCIFCFGGDHFDVARA